MSTENSVEGVKFVNAKPVNFPPVERRWASDFGRSAAYRSAAFHDQDGSVGGVPDAYIVIDNGIASDEQACEIKPSWNAAVCRGDIGRFSIGGNFGEFGAGPIADPIMLSRNGRRCEYTGETTIRSGAEVRVETAQEDLSLSLTGNGQGLLGDLRTSRLHHHRWRRAANQPGCAARRRRHVLLQGRRHAVGQACCE